jgi:hypothetical protein
MTYNPLWKNGKWNYMYNLLENLRGGEQWKSQVQMGRQYLSRMN